MPTELIDVGNGILVKAENLQIGGSHKARAAKAVIDAAEQDGHLRPGSGDTILEKSGGNFGIGLALHGIPRGYRIELLVRPGFSLIRRRLLASIGVTLVGVREMEAGWSNKQILDERLARAEAEGRRIFFTDQFSNAACIKGHLTGAAELVDQLLARGLDATSALTFVAGVGTGAHLVAYARTLREHFPLLKVVCAEPAGCSVLDGRFMDHPFQGLAVGVVPSLLDPSLIDDCDTATEAEAEEAGRELVATAGLFVGLSSRLVYAVAKKLREAGDTTVVMIAYDSGDAYFADAQSAPQRIRQVLEAIEWARAAMPPSETIGLSITDYEAVFTEAQSYMDEDLGAYLTRDPAAAEATMVETAYLCFKAVAVYRIAHCLYRFVERQGGFPASTRPHPTKIVARRLSEMIKSETRVEIHPGAEIGRRFVIDHGTDTVIGETAIIGDDCYILNDVTIGSNGVADNLPQGRRHPKLGNRVQVGGHSSLLGPITIGDDVFIGPHRQVLHDVPSRTRMTVVQELLMERVVGGLGGPRPEIHSVLPDIATGSLSIVGAHLDTAAVDFVDSETGGETPHQSVLAISQTAAPREMVIKVQITEGAPLGTVGLRMRTSEVSLVLQNSLSLRRALEALNGGQLVS